MLKGQDFYWIYEARPEYERTDDELYKDMADGYAKYLNMMASYTAYGAYSISFKEDEKVFYVYSGSDSTLTEVAALVPLECEDNVVRWYFEMQPQLLEIDVLRLVDSLYSAIKTMGTRE